MFVEKDLKTIVCIVVDFPNFENVGELKLVCTRAVLVKLVEDFNVSSGCFLV